MHRAECFFASRATTLHHPHRDWQFARWAFRGEVSGYLANALYTGSSAKAWNLLAEAIDLPMIEMEFLNGQESPTNETAEADFTQFGIRMCGYHDFGVALQDPSVGRAEKVDIVWSRGTIDQSMQYSANHA